MFRKSLIGALAVLGLSLAGTAASTVPASAGYSCGYWNGWCGAYFVYPGWGYGWYGNNNHHNWGKSHSHNNWNGNGNGNGNWNGNGNHNNNYQAYKNKGWNKYH